MTVPEQRMDLYFLDINSRIGRIEAISIYLEVKCENSRNV
jgi:hypothetical protein